MGRTSVLWFRRDLRLADNPALVDAAAADGVLPLFVLDPALWAPAGAPRRAYLGASLGALDRSLRERGGRLTVVRGEPAREVVRAALEVGAGRVHTAADFGPYGRRRDAAVERALAEHGVELLRTGSPYAVAPGRVVNRSGRPYQVFTPFARAWADHGWRPPVDPPDRVTWLATEGVALPRPQPPPGIELPEAGEAAARRRWAAYVDRGLDGYAEHRDRPDLDVTSRMSVHLKWGEIHPRTMLADLAGRPGAGPGAYRNELAWREFYADVLFHRPETVRDYLRPEFARMAYDEPGERLEAWRAGRTGYPIVDAGMRQLRATGWMHNRVRMLAAGFLVKDLHLEWQHGARHFMRWLLDADVASNQHGWQWVAGCGTDAAPYFRVFNPVAQGVRFDPDGDYVRRWVPELADVPTAHVHEPWTSPDGVPEGYAHPIVDHKQERREALERYEHLRR